MSATPPVVVIRGADEVLVRELVSSTVARLVGDGDHAMMVDDLMLPTRETTLGDEVPEVADVVGAAISAASTPPFLTERRVVVVRGCALLSTKEDVASLVQYLADPLPTTSLLLVWDLPHGSKVTRRSAPPKSLLEAVEACGGMVDDVDPAKKVAEWVKTRLGAEAIRFDAGAEDLLIRRVGDNPEVLVGYLTAIRGRYQPGDRVTAADLEPLLVEEGGVPPWDLTDAIEAGDPALAVHALQRMLGPGAPPPPAGDGVPHGLRDESAHPRRVRRGHCRAGPLGARRKSLRCEEGVRPGQAARQRSCGRAGPAGGRGRPRPARAATPARPPRHGDPRCTDGESFSTDPTPRCASDGWRVPAEVALGDGSPQRGPAGAR